MVGAAMMSGGVVQEVIQGRSDAVAVREAGAAWNPTRAPTGGVVVLARDMLRVFLAYVSSWIGACTSRPPVWDILGSFCSTRVVIAGVPSSCCVIVFTRRPANKRVCRIASALCCR